MYEQLIEFLTWIQVADSKLTSDEHKHLRAIPASQRNKKEVERNLSQGGNCLLLYM